jgi:hypothetical protein
VKIKGLKAVSKSSVVTTEITQIENGEKFHLSASLTPSQNKEILQDTIAVYINGSSQPEIEIPVFARVVK